MKKAMCVAIVAVAVMFSVNSYAEEQKVSPKVEQVSKQLGITIEEATKLVDNMQELAQVMGLKPAPAAEEKKDDSKKITGPEVANKALDMAGNAVSTISAQIEKAAPHVWRIMVKQQYANATAWIALPLGFFICGLVYRKWTDSWKMQELRDDDEGIDSLSSRELGITFVSVTMYVALVIPTLWLTVAVSFSIRHLVNPEYYAIRDMFQIVLGIK